MVSGQTSRLEVASKSPAGPTSALGQKQKSDWRPLMSAIHPKADIRQSDFDVRQVPKGDIQESARTKSKRRNIADSVGSGRLFTISDEDLVDHVEHANSKLPWHWCEPRRGLQGAVRIGQTLLPSRFHRRAAELEVL
jgi:hypothetical protein